MSHRAAPKRKSGAISLPAPNVGRKKAELNLAAKWGDEEIDSSDDDNSDNDVESEEEDIETAEQKRKRLAKQYLSSMQESDSDSEDDEYDSEADGLISSRLAKERLQNQGKYFRNLAETVSSLDMNIACTMRSMSGHEMPATCVAVTGDESSIYTGSKDNSIIRWDTETGQKTFLVPKWSKYGGEEQASTCHNGEVLAVAVTTDGRYVVSGGRNNCVKIYDSRINQEIKSFAGHRDAVTSCCFRRDSYSLFTGSLDRCIKRWDLNEMGYLETMFGHQAGVYALDCGTKEKPVSCSDDSTIRTWNVMNESHLVFRGHKGTIDAVQWLTEDVMLSGGQDGSLCVWKETQKKPQVQVQAAHGYDDKGNAHWISSLGALKMSDLVASGSNDGCVRLWNASGGVLSSNKKSSAGSGKCCEEVGHINVPGFVNGLYLSSRLMVAACGREHRLGRWWCLPGNKNKIHVARLPVDLHDNTGARRSSKDEDDSDEDDSADSGSDDST